MMGRARILLLLLGLASLLQAMAGERIVTGFQPGLPQGREVLQQVPVKVLVAEFIDPQSTGLGKSLGYMLWREALTAIQDQRGAGVIYAHTGADRPLADLLRRDYHLAALEIARAQNSRVVLWGAVAEQGGQVYVDSYLTTLPELVGDSLSLTVRLNGRTLPDLSSEVGRSRYGFAQRRYDRKELFRRAVVIRGGTRLRRSPSRSAPVVTRTPATTALQALDMQGSWFRVRRDDGSSAWVEIGGVDLPPRRVRIDRDRINVRSGPGRTRILRTLDLHGEFPVLDSRYLPGDGVWYRLRFPWGSGWVAAFLTEPRFTLPAIQFLAGLQRYQLENYEQASLAFRRFIDEAGSTESNVNLAAAHALLGASRLMQDAESRDGRRQIDRAVELTPYDPMVYDLRLLSDLARPGVVGAGAVDDLDRSLRLDPRNSRTLALLRAVTALSRGDPQYRPLNHLFRLDPERGGILSRLQRIHLDGHR